MCDLKLRPHHLIDIITGYGNDVIFKPHPYGHSQYLVAQKILSDLDMRIKLVLGADDICRGCMHLMTNGRCKDVLSQIIPSPPKQAYNDILDSRLFDHFYLTPGHIISAHKFLEMVNESIPGLEIICTHPKENPEKRVNGLKNGLTKLGIRNPLDSISSTDYI